MKPLPEPLNVPKRSYCPNPRCEKHSLGSSNFFVCYGHYRSKNSKERRQRFRCLYCRKTFSESVWTFDYWVKRRGLNFHIFRNFVEGSSNCQIARMLGCSETLVRGRLIHLSRQALLSHELRSGHHKIFEAVAYDGVENFARSQYEVNNINHAIGVESLFIWDFNFAPINRKGQMSPWQKLKKARIEKEEGVFPRNAIRQSTAILLHRLHERRGLPHFHLRSDRHYAYRDAIDFDLPALLKAKHQVIHLTISSKATRVYRHILHPVNHCDQLLRQQVKAFARETVSFSKTHGAMIQKYALFMAWKNYFRPQYVKKHKANPLSNTHTPAMVAGIETKPLSFGDFFGLRLTTAHAKLNSEWKLFYEGKHTYPRQRAA